VDRPERTALDVFEEFQAKYAPLQQPWKLDSFIEGVQYACILIEPMGDSPLRDNIDEFVLSMLAWSAMEAEVSCR
jgi:hypothetical protein